MHALLHIANGIVACGPVWAYWAFPMERFCGLPQPSIKSRRHPYASMDTWLSANTQLCLIKLINNVEDELSLNPPKSERRRGEPLDPTCAYISISFE